MALCSTDASRIVILKCFWLSFMHIYLITVDGIGMIFQTLANVLTSKTLKHLPNASAVSCVNELLPASPPSRLKWAS